MRKFINPSVRMIIEELQGQTVVPQAAGVQPAGVVKKPGQGPQQVAAGVQATAQTAAQQAAAGVEQQIAQQQGTTPAMQAQANKVAAAQPKQTKTTPQAQARGIQNDAMANRKFGQQGHPVVATEAVKTPPLPTGAEKELTNADDGGQDYNGQDQQTKRAKERAKEIDVGSEGPDKTSTMGLDGVGKGSKHNEITKPEDILTAKKAMFTEAERDAILDESFR